MGELSGKIAFVTGSASGIGRSTAYALAGAGAKLMLADLDKNGLDAVKSEINAQGGEAETLILDIADPEAVDQAIAATVKHYGRLDLAHNNAAIMGPIGPMAEYPLAEARKLFDVNVFGLLHCLQSEIKVMAAQGGGSIVNTCSVSGIRAIPYISIYTATKHAAIGLTKAAAREYSGAGIRINAVCPGYVQTGMTNGRFDAETEAGLAANHPIGRFAQPEEIAEAVLWLLGSRASFVTGSTLFVDGGSTT